MHSFSARVGLLLVVSLVVTGCFAPTEDIDLGMVLADGGSDAGGGSAMGGGTATGGGASSSDGGVLVQTLSVLPAERCTRSIPGNCREFRGCLAFLTPDGGDEVFSLHLDYVQAVVGRAGRGMMVNTNGAELWLFEPQGKERRLQVRDIADGGQLTALGSTIAQSPEYGVWYVVEEDVGGTLASRTLRLFTNTDALGPASVTNVLAKAPVSNGVAVGTDYFLALEDGLYSFYPAGQSRLVETPATQIIPAVASVDPREVFYVQCARQSPSACALWKWESPLLGTARTVQLAQLPSLTAVSGAAPSLRVLGDAVYVLSVQELLRVPRAGGAVETVYRGVPFVGGSLHAGSLEVVGDKVYFGGVCHPDSDEPKYGTVELNPSTSTARWLELDPQWPFVPYIADFNAMDVGRGPWAVQDGVFVMRP